MIYFKLAGILVAAICSMIAIFGDTTTNGKLNSKGKMILLLVFVGTTISLSLEVYQIQLEEEKTKITSEWQVTERLEIRDVTLSFTFEKEYDVHDLIKTLEGFVIHYAKVQRNSINDMKISELKIIDLGGRFEWTNQYVFCNTYFKGQIKKEEILRNKMAIKVFEKVNLDSIRKKIINVYDEGVTVAGEIEPSDSIDKVTGKRTIVGTEDGEGFGNDNWAWSTNYDFDWLHSNQKNLCGFKATFPWRYINKDLRQETLFNLAEIPGFTIDVPFELINVGTGKLEMVFELSDAQRFTINLWEFAEDEIYRTTGKIHFSGNQLYAKISDLFVQQNGRKEGRLEIY